MSITFWYDILVGVLFFAKICKICERCKGVCRRADFFVILLRYDVEDAEY